MGRELALGTAIRSEVGEKGLGEEGAVAVDLRLLTEHL
jgi:hypothetical protein